MDHLESDKKSLKPVPEWDLGSFSFKWEAHIRNILESQGLKGRKLYI